MEIYQLNIEFCINGGDVLFESYAHQSEQGAINHSNTRINEIQSNCVELIEDDNLDGVYSRYMTNGQGDYIYINIVKSQLFD